MVIVDRGLRMRDVAANESEEVILSLSLHFKRRVMEGTTEELSEDGSRDLRGSCDGFF
jgi:hypothetical protein